MKIAISGKGGVGKTTLTSSLAHVFLDKGKKILAIDADPDANLGAALGFDSSSITPISEMKELINERTGASPDSYGSMFTLNPKVDDLPDTLAKEIDGIKFMTLGGVKKGGGGCVCPGSTMLKNIIMHLVLARDEVVLIDMEAGLEHLGRGTSSGVDCLIIVVEPGKRSIETANAVKKLAADLGLKKLAVVANKIKNKDDLQFVKENISEIPLLGFIPYAESIQEADKKGLSVYKHSEEAAKAANDVYNNLINCFNN